MKKLVLILMISSLFGDTIKYQSSLLVTEEINNITFIGVFLGDVIYTKRKNDSNKYESILCETIIEVRDSYGNRIEFDCDIPLTIESSSSQTSLTSNSKSKKSIRLGALFITLGGLYLTSSMEGLNKTPELAGTSLYELQKYNKDVERSRDFQNTRALIGYGFIVFGGLLLFIGV